MKTSKCRSCDAEVRWVKTENDKWIPLDVPQTVISHGIERIVLTPYAPVGNIVIRGGRAHILGASEAVEPAEERYTSHFATCPQAGKWRQRGQV